MGANRDRKGTELDRELDELVRAFGSRLGDLPVDTSPGEESTALTGAIDHNQVGEPTPRRE